MSKVYLSGAISGLDFEEYSDNFGRAEALLVSDGYEVVNPLKVVACETQDCNGENTSLPDGRYNHCWSCWIKHDLIEMLGCDVIAMLPNSQNSAGAALEKYVAEKCGMSVIYLDEDYRGWKGELVA